MVDHLTNGDDEEPKFEDLKVGKKVKVEDGKIKVEDAKIKIDEDADEEEG